MGTIGLYDIDFNHGQQFSISLPLMKAYRVFINEGHQVIMMKPYEKTGRYNKVIYFKDSPKLIVPAKLNINPEKAKMVGYGFYGNSGITNQKIIDAIPDFTPYDLVSSRIKNKTRYQSVKINSLIDWREKDFTGARGGASITYVNDRDFLQEEDWKELYQHYDNNIEFVHPVRPQNYEDAEEFLNTFVTTNTLIHLPFTLNTEQIKEFSEHKGVAFNIDSVKTEQLFFFVFAAKIMGIEKISLYPYSSNDPFRNNLIKWALGGVVSYKDFLKEAYKDTDYYKLSYRILLKQNPKTITLQDISEYLTFN